MTESVEYKSGYSEGSWDMFNIVTFAYFGKEYYFKQSNGTVYSRLTGNYYASLVEALNEFSEHITG